MKKLMLIMLTTILAVSLTAGLSFAVDKLVVQDGAANDVFSVDDLGKVTATGSASVVSPADYTFMEQLSHADTNWKGGFFIAKRARGTQSAPLVVQQNDTVFTFDAQAWDGTAWARGGQIIGKVDGTPAAGKVPFFWSFRTMGNDGVLGDRFVINNSGNIGIGTLTPTHLIQLSGGAYSDGPTWVNSSSRELKKDIQEVTLEEAVQTIESLKPVSFVYKEGNQDMHVGFIAEDVPEMVATPDRKGLESMDIAAVLTKVVQEQQKTLALMQDKIISLENALQLKQDKELLSQK